MKPKSSAVWRYFDVSPDDDAICRICGRNVPRKTKSTSNLRSHIKHRHPAEFDELFATEYGKKKLAITGHAKDTTVMSKIPRQYDILPDVEVKKSSRKRKSSRIYYETLAANIFRGAGRDILPSKRLRKSLKESLVASGYNERSNDTEDSLLVPIKRRYSSEITDEDAAEQAAETEADVWSYFEKMPSNRARCILCKETFNRHLPFLTCHMNEKHRKVVMDLPSDSDDDQNCYTEVVYLEDEQTANVPLTETKPKRMKQTPEKQRKRTSSSRYEFVKPKEEEIDSKNDEAEEEIENFGRYIIGLLKKMPKDVSTQLQMDVISMIMTTKLKLETSLMESANGSVSSVQDGVAVTPGNVIVTTPSNVIHTGENNVSVPSLVIGIEKES